MNQRANQNLFLRPTEKRFDVIEFIRQNSKGGNLTLIRQWRRIFRCLFPSNYKLRSIVNKRYPKSALCSICSLKYLVSSVTFHWFLPTHRINAYSMIIVIAAPCAPSVNTLERSWTTTYILESQSVLNVAPVFRPFARSFSFANLRRSFSSRSPEGDR